MSDGQLFYYLTTPLLTDVNYLFINRTPFTLVGTSPANDTFATPDFVALTCLPGGATAISATIESTTGDCAARR
ncbi:hypothetical protein GCM10027185_33980 [Spirosoma pulveris]